LSCSCLVQPPHPCQTARQPASQPASQPATQLASQPAASQPASQAASNEEEEEEAVEADAGAGAAGSPKNCVSGSWQRLCRGLDGLQRLVATGSPRNNWGIHSGTARVREKVRPPEHLNQINPSAELEHSKSFHISRTHFSLSTPCET